MTDHHSMPSLLLASKSPSCRRLCSNIEKRTWNEVGKRSSAAQARTKVMSDVQEKMYRLGYAYAILQDDDRVEEHDVSDTGGG